MTTTAPPQEALKQALAARAAGRLDEALGTLRALLEIDLKQGREIVLFHLGDTLRHTGALVEAAEALCEAVAEKPDFAEAEGLLGEVFRAMGDAVGAETAYRRAIEIDPNLAAAHGALGNMLLLLGRLPEAEEAYRACVRLSPEESGGWANLGLTLREQGRVAEAATLLDEAAKRFPGAWVLRSNQLLNMHYDPRTDASAIAAAHDALAAVVAPEEPAPPAPPAPPASRADEIRVGFLSADLRQHPVGDYMAALLSVRPRSGWRALCYADVAQPDAVTREIQALADDWIETAVMSHDALQQRVRGDRLDILIDLAGHTARNRLPVMARRLAPRQFCWMGYVWWTGLPTVDGLITDAHHLPETEDALVGGRAVRLPRIHLPWRPPPEAPEPAPPRSEGAVVFGSANGLPKVTDATVDLWARVLEAVPDSRLVARAVQLSDPGVRAAVTARLEEAGIPAERATLLGPTNRAGLLSDHTVVDIVLDTFPYAGGATTLEALWMGTPVVTLPSDRIAGRHGAAFLREIGLERLVARDAGDYVEIARALASDRSELATLSSGLRARMQGSPMMDLVRFEAAFAGLLRSSLGRS